MRRCHLSWWVYLLVLLTSPLCLLLVSQLNIHRQKKKTPKEEEKKYIKDLSERFLIAQGIKSSYNWKVTSSTIKWNDLVIIGRIMKVYFFSSFIIRWRAFDSSPRNECVDVETSTAITHPLIRFKGIWIFILERLRIHPTNAVPT